jgi:hypothetical protein
MIRSLAISRVVDLATWMAELEEKILALSTELEMLRSAMHTLGSEVGLDE